MKTVNANWPYALPLVLALAAFPAQAVVKCTDEKGVTYYGDTLPPQCEKRAVTEINKQGQVIRKIDAAPTPDQMKAHEATRLKNIEDDKKRAELKLKDIALLSTYGAEREFDRARDRDIAQLDARQKTLQSRMGDLDKIYAKLAGEMEFYQAGKSKKAQTREAPAQLKQDLARAKNDREAADKELAKIDTDKVDVAARYDTEKQRWKKLRAGMPAGTLPTEDKSEPDTKVDAKNEPAPKPAAAPEPAKTPPAAKK